MSRTARQIDLSGRVVVFESLTKRRRGIFRLYRTRIPGQ
jgi:hypothetical protein